MKYRRYQLILEILTAATFVFIVVYLIVMWKEIPNSIVVHTDFNGRTRMGAKTVLFLYPIFTFIFDSIITAVQRIPKSWNSTSKGDGLPTESAIKIQNATLTLLVFEKLAATLMAAVLVFCAAENPPYEIAFIITGSALMLLAPVVYMIYYLRVKHKAKK